MASHEEFPEFSEPISHTFHVSEVGVVKFALANFLRNFLTRAVLQESRGDSYTAEMLVEIEDAQLQIEANSSITGTDGVFVIQSALHELAVDAEQYRQARVPENQYPDDADFKRFKEYAGRAHEVFDRLVDATAQ